MHSYDKNIPLKSDLSPGEKVVHSSRKKPGENKFIDNRQKVADQSALVQMIQSGQPGVEQTGSIENNDHSDNSVIQRRVGLEIEIPVPIDNLGVLTEKDKNILAGKEKDEKRLQELYKNADCGYGEFQKVDRYKLSRDHSRRVWPENPTYPIRVASRSILEIVFDPPVNTPEEVDETMKKINEQIAWIESATKGLTERAPYYNGLHIGPLPGKGKPPGLGYEGMLHVNLGVDTRQFHNMLDWYNTSKYKPRSEWFSKSYQFAIDAAEEVVKVLYKYYKGDPKEVQGFNGVRGITTLFALYLMAGSDDKVLNSTIKNFAGILTKTKLQETLRYALTPAELIFLSEHWESYKTALILGTRGPEAKMKDPLINRTKPSGELKESGWLNEDLFEDKHSPLLVAEQSVIAADEVGPAREKEDRVEHGKGDRRKGMVLEFRSLPGHYKQEEWGKVAKDFLAKSEELNAKKDYEPPPEKKPLIPLPVKPKESVEQRANQVSAVAKPVLKPLAMTSSQPRGVTQTIGEPKPSQIPTGPVKTVNLKEFWSEGQVVFYEECYWKVLKVEGAVSKKFTLQQYV